jgi:hypothetical protein
VRAFLPALTEKAYFAIELPEHPVGLRFKLTLVDRVRSYRDRSQTIFTNFGNNGSLAPFHTQEAESNAGEEQR